jgi:subtilisin family serine protease
MKPSFRKSYALAAAAASLGVGVFWLLQSSFETKRSANEVEVRRTISTTPIQPLESDRPLRLSMENGPDLRVAMDEVCVRDASGIETFVRLDPPATPASIRSRMMELSAMGEVLPVAYPENAERTAGNRAIVTSKLRVKLPDADGGKVAGANRLEVSERPAYAPGWTIMEAADPFAALEAVEGVRSSTEVASADVLVARQRFKRALPNDTLIGNQWYLKNSTTTPSISHINVEDVWKFGESATGYRGNGVRIGIVDDGVQTTHPDLSINVDIANDYDWNSNDFDANPSLSTDIHGTACAGVAAAVTNNGLGVAGVAPDAYIVGMRLISFSVTDQQVAEAMAWKNELIHVKNNSWGPEDTGKLMEGPEPLTVAALENAVAGGRNGKGTIFVWAAGNGRENGDNSNNDGFANRIETIAVGAMDSNGGQSDYSESGANLLLVAPSDGSGGLGIVTTDRTGTPGFNENSGVNGNYTTLTGDSSFGGTSSAAPVVSGVVALMLERNPDLGWRDVQEILIRSATKVQPSDSDWQTNSANFSFNHKFGAGLVNAGAAVEMAATWQNLEARSKRSVYSSNSSAIPEGGTVTRTFPVSGDTHRIEAVTVTVTATHSARGDLALTLTSPSGMKSRLSEVHNDPTPNFKNDKVSGSTAWTFSSVRHWGEFTGGDWTLEVTDGGTGNASGGTLGAVTLEFHGVSTGAINPAPVVQITSPAAGQPFSPGSTVTVSISATDLTVIGAPGEVAQVELLMDGLPVGVDTTAPYEFSISPPDGPHTLVARATDLEGATGTSPSIQIFLQNQAPVIHSVTLSASGYAYPDSGLSVTGISAVDPEGTQITYTYQWQYSTDDRTYTDQTGSTTAVLAASEVNSGKLWRCRVTPSDGVNTGDPFESPAVNVVNRPPLFAKLGAAVQHDSGLVIRGVEEAVNRRVIFNEVSQGNNGNQEWVELLVLKSGSLVGLKVGNFGKSLTFKDIPLWRNVPAGKLIVIYKGTSKDPLITLADNANPSTAGALVLPHMDFQVTTSQYFDNPNGALFGIGNDDTLLLSDADGDIHRITFGAGKPASYTTPVPLGEPVLEQLLNTKSASYVGGFEADANLASKWTLPSVTNATPGLPNPSTDGANAAFITRLKNQDLIEIPKYRLGSSTILPVGLSINPDTGRLSGSISSNATVGNYPIIIERYNKDEESVAQAFTLRVFANNYNQWTSSFPGIAAGVGGDGDGDGVSNLLEYALDRNPLSAEQGGAYTLSKGEGGISVIYHQSKIPADVTLSAEWSTALDGSVPWLTSGIQNDTLQEDGMTKVIRSTLPINPGDPKRFLRLRATLVSP